MVPAEMLRLGNSFAMAFAGETSSANVPVPILLMVPVLVMGARKVNPGLLDEEIEPLGEILSAEVPMTGVPSAFLGPVISN